MRVMCIVDKPWISINNPTMNGIGPAYGDRDVVTDVISYLGIDLYAIARFPGIGFTSKSFIPLSDTDPMEEIEEAEFEIIHELINA
jgi:hypothetical protein